MLLRLLGIYKDADRATSDQTCAARGMGNVVGNDLGNDLGKLMRIYIEPTVDRDKVLRALRIVPGFWKFAVREWDELKFEELGGEWKGFILPLGDNEIAIFDGAIRKVKYAGGTAGRRVGVAVFGWENELMLGLRIWHELLHTEGLDADGLLTNKSFTRWLPERIHGFFKESVSEHSWFWQIAYYTYLTDVRLMRK